jgi:hypothetical protein
MQTIKILHRYIYIDDIQRCVDLFREILNGSSASEKKIEITAETKIVGVDPLLISYFILFKKQLPRIEIILNLPFNNIDSEDDKLEYQLKQFGTYAYLTTGTEVFQIIFGNGHKKRIIKFDLNNHTSFPDRWFVFTADYFPMLLITKSKKHFDFIFNKSFRKLSNEYDFKIENENVYLAARIWKIIN